MFKQLCDINNPNERFFIIVKHVFEPNELSCVTFLDWRNI